MANKFQNLISVSNSPPSFSFFLSFLSFSLFSFFFSSPLTSWNEFLRKVNQILQCGRECFCNLYLYKNVCKENIFVDLRWNIINIIRFYSYYLYYLGWHFRVGRQKSVLALFKNHLYNPISIAMFSTHLIQKFNTGRVSSQKASRLVRYSSSEWPHYGMDKSHGTAFFSRHHFACVGTLVHKSGKSTYYELILQVGWPRRNSTHGT